MLWLYHIKLLYPLASWHLILLKFSQLTLNHFFTAIKKRFLFVSTLPLCSVKKHDVSKAGKNFGFHPVFRMKFLLCTFLISFVSGVELEKDSEEFDTILHIQKCPSSNLNLTFVHLPIAFLDTEMRYSIGKQM